MLGDRVNERAVCILLECNLVITGCNEVVANVMFLQVSVILSTGGVSREPLLTRQTPPDQGEPPRPRRTPPRPGRHPPGPRRTPPPWDQGEPPPDQGEPTRTRQTPPGRRLQHTVNERPVRILLECNLVLLVF